MEPQNLGNFKPPEGVPVEVHKALLDAAAHPWRQEATMEEYLTLKIERYKNLKGLPAVAMTNGRGIKPYAVYSFYTDKAREEYITEQKERIESHEKRKADDREARKQPHGLEVGNILSASWGYDQTNIDFYQVVAVKGRMVEIRQIQQKTTETGFMSGDTIPIKDSFIEGKDGEPTRHRPTVYIYDGKKNVSVKIDECATARLWDGEPEHCSWYA